MVNNATKKMLVASVKKEKEIKSNTARDFVLLEPIHINEGYNYVNLIV